MKTTAGVGEWIRNTEIRIGEKILRIQKFKSELFFFFKMFIESAGIQSHEPPGIQSESRAFELFFPIQ
jgi:hypothetical protein